MKELKLKKQLDFDNKYYISLQLSSVLTKAKAIWRDNTKQANALFSLWPPEKEKWS